MNSSGDSKKEALRIDWGSKPGIEFEALLNGQKQTVSSVKRDAKGKTVETLKLTGLNKTCDNSRLRSSQRKQTKQGRERKFAAVFKSQGSLTIYSR